jgi:hypothetical protein
MAVKKEKKDTFLIARVTSNEKNALLKIAQEKKIGLSKLVRQMIESFLENGGEK